jgi:TrmH family RNA methyltransferase
VVSDDGLAVDDIAELVTRLEATGIEVIMASAPVMAVLSPVRSPSRIVALSERPVGGERRMFQTTSAVIVCAADVQDPGNVGAIVRVAEAGGATGVIASGHSADPFGWKSLRGSMGSALRLPIATDLDTLAALDDARRHGCRIVVTVPRGGRTLDEARLDGATLLVVGGEGAGLSASVVAAADERVTIPMAAPVESLNTAICAALAVYEVRRQRIAARVRGSAAADQV